MVAAPLPPAQPTGPPRPQQQAPLPPGLGPGAGQTEGEATRPNPTDRGTASTKQPVVVDRRGVPPAVVITPLPSATLRCWRTRWTGSSRRLQGRPRLRPAT